MGETGARARGLLGLIASIPTRKSKGIRLSSVENREIVAPKINKNGPIGVSGGATTDTEVTAV